MVCDDACVGASGFGGECVVDDLGVGPLPTAGAGVVDLHAADPDGAVAVVRILFDECGDVFLYGGGVPELDFLQQGGLFSVVGVDGLYFVTEGFADFLQELGGVAGHHGSRCFAFYPCFVGPLFHESDFVRGELGVVEDAFGDGDEEVFFVRAVGFVVVCCCFCWYEGFGELQGVVRLGIAGWCVHTGLLV